MKRGCISYLFIFTGAASIWTAWIVNGESVNRVHQAVGWFLAFVVAHTSDALYYAAVAVPVLVIDAIAGPCHLLPTLRSLIPFHDFGTVASIKRSHLQSVAMSKEPRTEFLIKESRAMPNS